jgi:hypothetical protein
MVGQEEYPTQTKEVTIAQPAGELAIEATRRAVPPNLIPERMSPKNQDWLDTHSGKESAHTKAVAGRQALQDRENPRLRRAY